MKICTRCNTRQPDNFMMCSRCGTPISELESTGVPMRLYMYNQQMGKKTGAVSRHAIVPWVILGIAALFILPFIVLIITFVLGISSETAAMILVVFFIMLMGVIPVALVLLAVLFQGKRMKDNIAFIYYDGILYKLIMQPFRMQRPNPNARLYVRSEITAEFRRRCSNPSAYLQFFEQYLSGVQLWDPMWGGQIYIEPLHQFHIINANQKFYQYSYVSPNGQVLNGQIDNAYPGIEEIFNCCR